MEDLLEHITDPAALRHRTLPDLEAVAKSLRAFLLQSVSQTGGHLSANLGTVELAVALHHVYETPHDRLIWDVGHQAYPHKILTGRADRMGSLRQLGGISGFPRREESEYDAFGTAHSSTSISAALGMAKAAQLKGERRRVVAVIGDGALSAGMAFEAMNNAAASGCDLLVILNDNHMSISPPVGELSDYLTSLMRGRYYAPASAARTGKLMAETPFFEVAQRQQQEAQGWSAPDTLFAKLGFAYHGPIDGHDLNALVTRLRDLREARGPQLLHVVTQKGKGYPQAEADPIAYHGPGKFDPKLGLASSGSSSGPPTYTQVFGRWICDMAARDPRLVGITPAMREGSGLVEFSQKFPSRYADVGIAEQHAVTFAAGLACEGMKPVVAIYSTFLQRAYDQLVHDVALQNLPVLFAIDRAGLVGADGATHAGVFDIPYLRCIPHMGIATPADANECRELLSVGYAQDHPVAVRYPRGQGPAPHTPSELGDPQHLREEIGRGEIRRLGKSGLLMLAFGPLLYEALKVAEGMDATVVNMRWVKPIDTYLLRHLAPNHSRWVTLEEGAIEGGAGSAVVQWLQREHRPRDVLVLGIPDTFTDQGDPARLLSRYGLDANGIRRAIAQRWPQLAPYPLGGNRES